MKIQKRGTNSKGHTTHYKVGGKWRTRKETVDLAEKGKVQDVVVYQRGSGKHIQAHRSAKMKLYDIPKMRKV